MAENDLLAVAELLRKASSIVFLSGAGISRESGIPTFREAQSGLWANYNPEELATPQAFKRNPKLVWTWYDERRANLLKCKPNPGHYAVAELEKTGKRVVVVTQNVDGLHKEAGSSDVIELHGNISEFYCFDRHHPASNIEFGLQEPPLCHCGSLIRPAVVWFNEALPEDALRRAEQEIESASVLFVVGTSSLVYPAAALPMLAYRKQIPIVEMNPEATPLSEIAGYIFRARSGEILPKLLQELQK